MFFLVLVLAELQVLKVCQLISEELVLAEAYANIWRDLDVKLLVKIHSICKNNLKCKICDT